MKVLLATFSKYLCYQNAVCGMADEIEDGTEAWLMADKTDVFNGRERYRGVNVPVKNGFCFGTFNIYEVIKTILWIRKMNFDCIYFESVHIWNIIIMCICKNVKFVAAIHDVIPHEGGLYSKILDVIYRATTKYANGIVVRNFADVEKFTNIYGSEELKIECLPLCYPFPQRPEITKRRGKVLFFGRINSYKGIDNLYKIAEKMPEEGFVICGKPVPEMEKQLEMCEKLPNVVINSGYVSDSEMYRYFKECDCVVLPYKSATQSGVILDAYRSGKPVIAFDVGAIKEQVRHKTSGYIIPPGDIDAFCNAIKEIRKLTDNEYEELCISSYTFGYELFSAKKVTGRFLKILSEI